MPALDLDLGLTSRISQTRFVGDQLLAMTSAQLVSPFPTDADSRRGQRWVMRSSLKIWVSVEEWVYGCIGTALFDALYCIIVGHYIFCESIDYYLTASLSDIGVSRRYFGITFRENRCKSSIVWHRMPHLSHSVPFILNVKCRRTEQIANVTVKPLLLIQ